MCSSGVLERDTHFNQADLRVDRTDSAPVLDEPQQSEVQNPVSWRVCVPSGSRYSAIDVP